MRIFAHQITVRHTAVPAPACAALVGPTVCLLSIVGANQATASASHPAAQSSSTAFLARLATVTSLGSTVPANGDLNPFGIVVVPRSVGALHAGSLLISNFDAKSNNQGARTTIDELTPTGHLSLFATVNAATLPGKLPRSRTRPAIAVLPGGYVVVGSLPTTNGQSATAKAGGVIVLDSSGHPVKTISGPQIAGPWDMTSVTHGSATTLFVRMVLDDGAAAGAHTINNSTVLRIRLHTVAVSHQWSSASRSSRAGSPGATTRPRW
jgi:hypothetical protein